MAVITHDARLAFDAATGLVAENVLGAVYLDTDTGLTTPLEVTVFGAGSASTAVTSTSVGVVPEFELDQDDNGLTGEEGVRVVWASGSHRTVLLSTSRVFAALTPLTSQFHYIHPVSAGVWDTPPTLPAPPNARRYFFDSEGDATMPKPIVSFPTLQTDHRWWPAPGVDPNA